MRPRRPGAEFAPADRENSVITHLIGDVWLTSLGAILRAVRRGPHGYADGSKWQELPLSRHPFRLLLLVVVLAFGLTYVAAVTVVSGTKQGSVSSSKRLAGPATTSPDGAALAGGRDALGRAIRGLQERLRQHPRDSVAWAELGSAYVQQARITANPVYYPKAEGALNRSRTLKRRRNFEAMVGLGALANAQHDFTAGRSWGRQAEAINRYNANVYAVLNDALTQLGDYRGATAATQRMLDLRPGVPSYTRASYDFEQHGDNAGARFALDKALEIANSPADIAFCRYYLGELAFNEGKANEAALQYAAGLKVDRAYDPLLAGQAKAEAALGRTAAAVRDYTTVISRVPQPQYVIELGELKQSLGHHAAAQQQYKLLGVELKLFAANGVSDDLTAAVFEADHGSPAKALKHAQTEWGRRHSVLVADALAWALHVNHRDTEALVYANFADHLGWRNATFLYHRGMIEAALGQQQTARADLVAALGINPFFNPLHVPIARSTLAQLGPTR